VYSKYSELVVFMYLTSKSMNNLLSYCGLVDATITASEKDLHQVFISQKFKKLKEEEESLPFSPTGSADSLGISILSSVEPRI
jgi:hypothetical protein